MLRTFFLLLNFLAACGRPEPSASANPPTMPADSSDPVSLADTADPYRVGQLAVNRLFEDKKDSMNFSYWSYDFGLRIGNLFERDVRHAILSARADDSTLQTVVLRENQRRWDMVFNQRTELRVDGPMIHFAQLNDFDGDHVPDLKIVQEYWDIHPGDRSKLWLYRQGHFSYVNGFEQVISGEYDSVSRLIYAYRSMGCADMSMYFGVFRIAGNRIHKERELYCDCCIGNGDSCEIQVFGRPPYTVPLNKAYQHVPAFHAAFVREKTR